MRSLPLLTGNACALCCLMVAVVGNATLAQTTGTVSPSAENSPNEEPPPGGCMPIGLTASGEIVFPFQCKDFIERHKAAKRKPTALDDEKPNATEEKTTAVEAKPVVETKPPVEEKLVIEAKPVVKEKPAVEANPVITEKRVPADEEKAAAKQPESVATKIDRPETELIVKTPSPRHVELDTRKHAGGPPDCTRFRTYDPTSQTYRAYDGQLRPCR
jgi:hypothetical protein